MSTEPTTISAVATLIAETLQTHYKVDPAPLFQQAGLDLAKINDPNSRINRAKIMTLWDVAAAATKDPCIGLVVGFNIRPTSYYALGYAWLASRTLLEALERLVHYYQVIVTAPLELSICKKAATYRLEVVYPDPKYAASPIALDSFLASIVKLCRSASSTAFRPQEVFIAHEEMGDPATYRELFDAPVHFSAGTNALCFERKALDALLPGENPALVQMNDKASADYLDSLDPDKVASEVRRLLLNLLPAGKTSQQQVASRMHRSLSKLQRQLHAEGTSYMEIREDTRQSLGEKYVRERKLSMNEIAFLLGFSDQSNFSRAFKRWTGMTPRQFQSD
jgi:AraC-like DNA-binding protein